MLRCVVYYHYYYYYYYYYTTVSLGDEFTVTFVVVHILWGGAFAATVASIG